MDDRLRNWGDIRQATCGKRVVGNVAFIPKVAFRGYGPAGFDLGISAVISAIGFALITIGFWNAGVVLGARGMTSQREQGAGNEEGLERIEISD